MKQARRVWWIVPSLVLALLCGCETQEQLQVEKLPVIKPSLPAVPKLPPPPHPIQHADGSYSLFGLRKKMRTTMDTEVELTGYVVETYVPPTCPRGETCPPARAPHVFLADTREEADVTKRIMLVGYADNQKAIDRAAKKARRSRANAEEGAVPTDLLPGAKIKVKAQFTRYSTTGFAYSDGLLEYRSHETLEPAEGA